MNDVDGTASKLNFKGITGLLTPPFVTHVKGIMKIHFISGHNRIRTPPISFEIDTSSFPFHRFNSLFSFSFLFLQRIEGKAEIV